MYTIKNYVLADSLEQAYALKQKSRNNIIVGGNLWLKMGRRPIQNAIDLSLLGLDKIEEDESGFLIGCMVSLRDLEVHEQLNQTFYHVFREAVRHIVGVQFRNCATVGGSIFPRFGFSDVLSAFLACDSYVDLFHAGRIPLKEFIQMPVDSDILTHIYIKKDGRKICYQSFRMTETDFPVLTCAVMEKDGSYMTVLGARPKSAILVDEPILKNADDSEEKKRFAEETVSFVEFGSNLRGSAKYREELAKILIQRGLKQITEGHIC